ncbi:MAG: hypothetical protein ACPGJV_01855 [Bacteriovoracaceae bacterium]
MQKEIDFLVEGDDFLSIIYAINLLRNRKEVLFYQKDDEISLKAPCHHTLNAFDLAFLKLLAEKLNSDVLKDIDSYLKPAEIYFRGENFLFRTTQSPWENLLQVIRKFPDWFEIGPQTQPREDKLEFDLEKIVDFKFKDQFDEDFSSTVSRLAENCFRYRTIENLTASLFETHCPEYLVGLVQTIRDNFNLFKKQPAKSYAYRSNVLVMRFAFQQLMDLSWGEVEIYHFVLSFLSAQYELDFERFITDLQSEYCRIGGHLGKAEIFNSAPVFEKNQVKLSTQNTEFVASSYLAFDEPLNDVDQNFGPRNLIKLKDSSYFRGVSFIAKWKDQDQRWSLPWVPERLGQKQKITEQHYIYDYRSLGGDLSLWIIKADGNELHCHSWVQSLHGLKADIYRTQFKSFLINFELIDNERELDELDIDIFLKNQVMSVGSFNFSKIKLDLRMPKKFQYSFSKSPSMVKSMATSLLLGAKRETPLGIFGKTMEIKDVSAFSKQ